MGVGFAFLGGSAETDFGFADDEGRAAVTLDGFGEGGIALGDIVGVNVDPLRRFGYTVLKKDENGNVIRSNIVTKNSKNISLQGERFVV